MTETKKQSWKFPKLNFAGPIAITVEVLLLIFAIWAVNLGVMIYGMMTTPRPAAVVATDLAKAEKWPVVVTAVTQLQSPLGTVLKAEVGGMVKEINFTPGQVVKKGDLLITIDADAERAAAKLARLNFERAQSLREQGVNSQNDLDSAEANNASAKAALDRKEIRAPFDGKVGLNQVFVGQYVTPGMAIVPVESLQTMYADFGLPQQSASLIAKAKKVVLTVDSYKNESFEGVIEGADPRVDSDTLTIGVRAIFQNPNEKLLGGMFGTVTVYLSDENSVVVVPSTSIVYSAYGSYVYVVETGVVKAKDLGKVAKQKFVKLGATRGDFVEITDGLIEGEEVVSAGQMKLRNGVPVQIDNTQKPVSSETPHPAQS